MGLARTKHQAIVLPAGGGGSGVANFLSRVKAGLRLSNLARLIVPAAPAPKLTMAPARLIVPEKPACRLTALTSGTVLAPEKPAAKLALAPATLKVPEKPAARLAMAPATLKMPEKPAVNMTQVTFDLVHGSWVVTAAQDAGGTGTWNNPTRMQGVAEGNQANSATFAGGLVLGTGKLRGTMVAQPNRPTSLIIDEVYLEFSGQTTGLPIVSDLISNLQLGYRINLTPVPGVDTTLEQLTSNQTKG